MLDALKQLGLYTDCLGEAHWSIPMEVVDETLAKSLVVSAEILAPERTITVRELELWVKHLKPVWGKDFEWMKRAVANWYAEMQSEGLAPRGANQMEAFLKQGLTTTQMRQMAGTHEA